MKIRKAIAATLIAGTALVGTTTAADAFNPVPEPPDGRQQHVEQRSIFTDGFESGDTARVSHYHWVLKDAIITSYG